MKPNTHHCFSTSNKSAIAQSSHVWFHVTMAVKA
jgi:hypothetical protein